MFKLDILNVNYELEMNASKVTRSFQSNESEDLSALLTESNLNAFIKSSTQTIDSYFKQFKQFKSILKQFQKTGESIELDLIDISRTKNEYGLEALFKIKNFIKYCKNLRSIIDLLINQQNYSFQSNEIARSQGIQTCQINNQTVNDDHFIEQIIDKSIDQNNN